MNKAAHLRALLGTSPIIRLVGAHDALGARLAERHGFDGVWASGLEISAAHGVPDESVLTQEQFLSAAITINSATKLPVVCDCDTGFGDAAHIGSVVEQYESAGIAAITIEDKQFPKKNSFIEHGQILEDIDLFANKIRVAKHAQKNSDFMIIARTESFIAGTGIDDALARGYAYRDAGADALVVHSRLNVPDEVYAFAHAWQGDIPLIVIPTKFYAVTGAELARHGFAFVIYANHGLRASLRAVDEVFAAIARHGSTATVEEKIATLDDVFEITKKI